MSGYNLPPGCSQSDIPGCGQRERRFQRALKESEKRWQNGSSEDKGDMIAKAEVMRDIEEFPHDVIDGYASWLFECREEHYKP